MAKKGPIRASRSKAKQGTLPGTVRKLGDPTPDGEWIYVAGEKRATVDVDKTGAGFAIAKFNIPVHADAVRLGRYVGHSLLMKTIGDNGKPNSARLEEVKIVVNSKERIVSTARVRGPEVLSKLIRSNAIHVLEQQKNLPGMKPKEAQQPTK